MHFAAAIVRQAISLARKDSRINRNGKFNLSRGKLETGTRIQNTDFGNCSARFSKRFPYVSGRMATLHVEPNPGSLIQNKSLPRETAESCQPEHRQ
jgi:hypothetical protein